MASQDLTPETLVGFSAQLDGKHAHEACPHYTSSPAGVAWLVGAWLPKTGRLPRDVRASCGFLVGVGDMRARLGLSSVLFECAARGA